MILLWLTDIACKGLPLGVVAIVLFQAASSASTAIIFTTMLTLAYSLFQGNVGTAYRQRSQLLVFYFIFVAVGAVILKERAEERRRRQQLAKLELAELQAARVLARRKATDYKESIKEPV